MNRPSLYGAFGDKRDIYMKAYKHYGERARQRMAGIFAADLPLRALLRSVYGLAIEMYLSGEDGPRGCFTVMTATSEAVFDPQLRGMVQTSLTEMDRFFARLFEAAMVKGELPKSANSETLAQLATATIHTIAVRARAGVPKKDLEAIANGAIGLICGPDNDRVRDKRQKR